MNSVYSSLLFSLAGLVVGFVGGQSVVWRRHGSLIVPTYHPRPKLGKADLLIGVLIVLLAVGTLAQGIINQQKQTDCNNDFRRVISERGDLATRQNAASVQLQERLIAIGKEFKAEQMADPAVRDRYIQAHDDARAYYVHVMKAINTERDNNPYPTPRC